MSDRATDDQNRYEDAFVDFSNRVERWLRKAVWTGLALLLLGQALLAVPAVRSSVVRVERLEGVPYRLDGMADR